MNRIEALAHFENNYVQAKVLEKILQAESYLWQNRDQLAAEFRESLRIICRKIKALQMDGQLDKVGFINYALLRSALLTKKPQYRIDVYNKEWYFAPTQPECPGEYDASRIWRFLDGLEAELEEPRRLYLNQITPVYLEQVKLREAVPFNQLIISLADYALHQDAPIAELTEIFKEAEFEVRVGEYYDVSEVVYKEDRRPKELEVIKEWLEDKHENQYIAAVLQKLDLSGGDYRELNLRRVDFGGSNLSDSKFVNSTLIKARFNNCLLNQADFSEAVIHDANFNGAELKQANLFAVQGVRGMAETMESQIYSVWGVNFRGADLTKADLRHADLRGADFRGAQLLQTKFYGAKLDNATFDQAALSNLDLNATQIKTINWA
jgi:uncharacterized protein YjbI with pentapeptide repeats